MTPIAVSVDIDRPQDELFSYVTDPSRFAEWQPGVAGGQMENGAAVSVGSKCMTTRRIGVAEREVTTLDPLRAWAVHGIDEPIRAIVDVTVEPVNDNGRSRVRIELDFEGHGIGKLLVPPTVRRQARNKMPANVQRLKKRVEAQATPPLA